MVVLFHLICKVIKLGEWSSGMIPRLGLLPNIKFEEARGSIPRLPQFIFFNFWLQPRTLLSTKTEQINDTTLTGLFF